MGVETAALFLFFHFWPQQRQKAWLLLWTPFYFTFPQKGRERKQKNEKKREKSFLCVVYIHFTCLQRDRKKIILYTYIFSGHFSQPRKKSPFHQENVFIFMLLWCVLPQKDDDSLSLSLFSQHTRKNKIPWWSSCLFFFSFLYASCIFLKGYIFFFLELLHEPTTRIDKKSQNCAHQFSRTGGTASQPGTQSCKECTHNNNTNNSNKNNIAIFYSLMVMLPKKS